MESDAASHTPRLTIGTMSKRTGLQHRDHPLLRAHRIGLLSSPVRSAGGHRQYDEPTVRRLTFIRRSRQLGFSLEEVRGLLGLVDGGDYTCGEVRSLTLDHLEDVRAKRADLRRMEVVLKEMVSQCDGGTVPDCPIIDTLFRGHE